MIGVYRGHSSLFEFLAAGALIGSFYKFHLGPKGMISGGVFGGLFGLLGGFLSTTILKLSGQSMEDMRYWQYKWREVRDKTTFEVKKSIPTDQSDDEGGSADNVLLFYHKTPGKTDGSLNALDAPQSNLQSREATEETFKSPLAPNATTKAT